MVNGTWQDMRPIGDDEAARLQRVVDEHSQVNGRCGVCGGRRRCWTRSTAWATLVLADRVTL